MKRIIYIVIVIFFVAINVYAQHNGTILTPKGNSIEYYNGYLGDTTAYRAYADSLINSNSWDATLVASGTSEYNCHAFAWHTSEGGADCWINGWKDGDVDYLDQFETPTNTPTNITNYWTNNGGYHNITIKIANAKVFYGSQWSWEYDSYYGYSKWKNKKDHSAIVDSNTNYFISKWGSLPRYKHKPEDCPYVGSGLNLSYYFIDNPIISGTTSGALCNNIQRTYSESAFTCIELDYDWNVSGELSEISDGDESSYTVEGSSQDGEGSVSLTVTTPSGANGFS
jgi:hypothetical protein